MRHSALQAGFSGRSLSVGMLGAIIAVTQKFRFAQTRGGVHFNDGGVHCHGELEGKKCPDKGYHDNKEEDENSWRCRVTFARELERLRANYGMEEKKRLTSSSESCNRETKYKGVSAANVSNAAGYALSRLSRD
jgi:hypothetical protein